MKHITFIRSNLLSEDPRTIKEINSLKKENYTVTLLCWNRGNKSIPLQEMPENIQKVSEFKLRVPSGPRILPFIPVWWCFVFLQLMITRTDIVHAINLDCIVPAFLAAKIKRRPIVYEMFDTYEDEIVLPGLIRSACISVDKFIMRFVDVIILVDECRIREFKGIPNKNVAIIYNSSPDLAATKEIIQTSRDGNFLIFYAGALNKDRSLDQVIEAMFEVERVKLIIAGAGELQEKVLSEAKRRPERIEYLGQIGHEEVIERTFSADLVFSLYDTRVPLSRYASSNKLFDAMMCAKPILVSSGSSMDEIVLKINCGLAVDCHSGEDIKKAITRLRDDPQLCVEMGTNGRKAFEQTYNWKIMENKLFELYKKIEG